VISSNRFPPPWSVEEPDPKLDRHWCYIVRDANGHALAYVYFEDEPQPAIGHQADDARRGAAHCSQHRQAAGAAGRN
jgi:hypothetical protein